MIIIVIPAPFPRLLYALEVVFGCVLKVPYKWSQVSDFVPNGSSVIVNYTSQDIPGSLSIPNSGFLTSEKIAKHIPTVDSGALPHLFFQPGKKPGLPYDIFAATFFLVTEYEKQASPKYDGHGRYLESEYESFRQGWFRHPLVNLYVKELWELLRPNLPGDFQPDKTFRLEITFDIDHPWKYLHKDFVVTAGGLVKRLVTGKWRDAKDQIRTLSSGKDPNDTFQEIFSICPPDRTRFFFLGGRNCDHDTRFTFQHPIFRELIRDIASKGYGIGVHPSYHSFLDPEMIAGETQTLSHVVDTHITHSRQHFLKYRLPETYRHLLNAGIRHEYSLSMVNGIGFRTGIANPYPWFDLEKNKATPLILHPTFLMDWTLNGYMKLRPEEAVAKALDLIQMLKSVGAEGAFLFHNDALSDSGPWKGWKDGLLKIIGNL